VHQLEIKVLNITVTFELHQVTAKFTELQPLICDIKTKYNKTKCWKYASHKI